MNIETLFFVVVGRGKANAILRKAQELGATGGTIFLGEGTIQSKLLDIMGITEIHKEILMIPATQALSEKLHTDLSNIFKFSKRNKGIAFTIPFEQWQASKPESTDPQDIKDISHFCIVTIVDKGQGLDCVKVARSAGARGGTLIHGRGAGTPTDFYFPIIVEPQKDIVLIITSSDTLSPVREKIFKDMNLGIAGNGIIFILPVSQSSGLFESRTESAKGGSI